MGKHKNIRKKFNYDKNRRRSWRNKKKLPTIACEPVKKAWDEHKSIVRNLKDMGLSADPNKTLRILTTKNFDHYKKSEHKLRMMKIVKKKIYVVSCNVHFKNKERLEGQNANKYFETSMSQPVKQFVLAELEKEANAEQPSRLDMSDPDVQFCKYLLEKYGDNYVSMARDKRNFYQDTPKQIRRKIEKFKKVMKFSSNNAILDI